MKSTDRKPQVAKSKMAKPPKVAKQRGAQPGNTNALKHGFYSRLFRQLEHSDLETAFDSGLEDEISMLRVATRRFFDMANGCENPDQAAKTLSVLGLAATRLASLLRAQRQVSTSQRNQTLESLHQALLEVHQEMGLS